MRHSSQRLILSHEDILRPSLKPPIHNNGLGSTSQNRKVKWAQESNLDHTLTSERFQKETVLTLEVAHCSLPPPVDLELNRDFNGEDYEYEDEAKLVIFPDHFEIPLPNIEELPALVRELVLPALCVFFLHGRVKVHSS